MRYASVYPLVTTRALARPFTYAVGPEVGRGAVAAGALRRRAGSEASSSRSATSRRPGSTRPRPSGSWSRCRRALVDLALWLADYYGSTPGRALGLVAPPGRVRARWGSRAPAEREALEGEPRPERLTESQAAAVARIVAAIDAGRAGRCSSTARPGSGKTEVYLQACAEALERGLGAIVLVPEIALTPQAVGRFRARFGDRIAILHSALTDAERLRRARADPAPGRARRRSARARRCSRPCAGSG